MAAGGCDGGDLGIEEEIGWDDGGGGGVVVKGKGRIGLEAREVVDGGAYGLKLAEEVIWNWRVKRGGGFSGNDGGGEVVEGEDIGGNHGYQKEEIQTHRETHREAVSFLIIM